MQIAFGHHRGVVKAMAVPLGIVNTSRREKPQKRGEKNIKARKEIKMADKKKTDFEVLYGINVNDKTEAKNGLTYLSWAYAIAEFKKVHPNMTYEVKKFENGLPYVYDENTGYMVFTSVTVDDLTHEMWLPVMDGNNKAMLNYSYTFKNKYGKEIEVKRATMFDINKTIMRCLTKNLAMFGLGLYIYAGEDLPEENLSDDEKIAEIKRLIQQTNTDTTKYLAAMGVHFKKEFASVDDMSGKELDHGLTKIRAKAKGVM